MDEFDQLTDLDLIRQLGIVGKHAADPKAQHRAQELLAQFISLKAGTDEEDSETLATWREESRVLARQHGALRFKRPHEI